MKNDLNQEDSKVTDFTTPDKETVANTLKKWCEKNIETPLASETMETIWAKVDKRCLQPKE
ncbi:hypothetical protein A6V39_00285 [Candidatus Mycoplasma haematobovis]|uniref:Uncharacterized protein n=1 Tax=Candidatus Mycoplasma haematobovis TaxID=432608 RepID=A0A1A9QDD2_9MOLU|nr:hypothetical protein [Candidatus Mycoplasma haematobovis]OAL10487.1 hypothetical protein A6V39_00285 [Candidatus Mycoplasma haematobovis]